MGDQKNNVPNKLMKFSFGKMSPSIAKDQDEDDVVDISKEVLLGSGNKRKRRSVSNSNQTTKRQKSVEDVLIDSSTETAADKVKDVLKDSLNVVKPVGVTQTQENNKPYQEKVPPSGESVTSTTTTGNILRPKSKRNDCKSQAAGSDDKNVDKVSPTQEKMRLASKRSDKKTNVKEVATSVTNKDKKGAVQNTLMNFFMGKSKATSAASEVLPSSKNNEDKNDVVIIEDDLPDAPTSSINQDNPNQDNLSSISKSTNAADSNTSPTSNVNNKSVSPCASSKKPLLDKNMPESIESNAVQKDATLVTPSLTKDDESIVSKTEKNLDKLSSVELSESQCDNLSTSETDQLKTPKLARNASKVTMDVTDNGSSEKVKSDGNDKLNFSGSDDDCVEVVNPNEKSFEESPNFLLNTNTTTTTAAENLKTPNTRRSATEHPVKTPRSGGSASRRSLLPKKLTPKQIEKQEELAKKKEEKEKQRLVSYHVYFSHLKPGTHAFPLSLIHI